LSVKAQGDAMQDVKRATIYFEADVHRALRLKAAAADRSISDLVNEAVKVALAEDVEDLAAIDARRVERSVAFESLVRGLRQRGRI
jgi:plasmid stability protein